MAKARLAQCAARRSSGAWCWQGGAPTKTPDGDLRQRGNGPALLPCPRVPHDNRHPDAAGNHLVGAGPGRFGPPPRKTPGPACPSGAGPRRGRSRSGGPTGRRAPRRWRARCRSPGRARGTHRPSRCGRRGRAGPASRRRRRRWGGPRRVWRHHGAAQCRRAALLLAGLQRRGWGEARDGGRNAAWKTGGSAREGRGTQDVLNERSAGELDNQNRACIRHRVIREGRAHDQPAPIAGHCGGAPRQRCAGQLGKCSLTRLVVAER